MNTGIVKSFLMIRNTKKGDRGYGYVTIKDGRDIFFDLSDYKRFDKGNFSPDLLSPEREIGPGEIVVFGDEVSFGSGLIKVVPWGFLKLKPEPEPKQN